MTGAGDLSRARIELEVGEAKRVCDVAVSGAPQQGSEPGEELRESEGLRKVVVRSCIETGHAAVDFGASGEHQYGNGVTAQPQPPAHLESVDAGHQDVEDRRVRGR